MSGYPSATGLAQDRESLPSKGRRSTAVPRNQPTWVGIMKAQTLRLAKGQLIRFVCVM